jgi:hypothetical protein
MRWLSAFGLLVVGGASGLVLGVAIGNGESSVSEAPWGQGPPEVSNAFWDEVAVGKAGSSVEPESNCKELAKQEFRCYARWAPVGHVDVLTYEGTVNVYPDGRIIVSGLTRHSEARVKG